MNSFFFQESIPAWSIPAKYVHMIRVLHTMREAHTSYVFCKVDLPIAGHVLMPYPKSLVASGMCQCTTGPAYLYRSVPISLIYQCNDPIAVRGGLGCFPSLLLSGNSPLRGDPKRSSILVRADQLGSFNTPHSKTATWHVSSGPLSCLVWWHVSAVGSFFSKISEVSKSVGDGRVNLWPLWPHNVVYDPAHSSENVADFGNDIVWHPWKPFRVGNRLKQLTMDWSDCWITRFGHIITILLHTPWRK